MSGRGRWDALALATSLGLTTAFVVTAGIYAGKWADARLGTDPLFTIVGFGVGVGVGVVMFIRWVRRIGREDP
jgi:F0F1-type ATP synthase assembly protein I